MAGQRPEWTSLLFRRRQAEHLADELPPNDQTLDFVSPQRSRRRLAPAKPVIREGSSFLDLCKTSCVQSQFVL